MTTQPKTKVFAKPEAQLKSQSHVEPRPAAHCRHRTELGLNEHMTDSAITAHGAETQRAQLPRCSQNPVVMDTTIELLENSDAQDRMDDVRKRAPFRCFC